MSANLKNALKWVFQRALMNPHKALGGETAIPYIYAPGSEGSRLVLVLGDNGAGKSMFRRMLALSTATKNGKAGPFPVEMIQVSMEARCTEGMHRVFMFGSEEWQSTGGISGNSVMGAITTARGRNHEVAVYLDEPDMGMSAACSAGVGVVIREFVDTLPDHVRAVVVTTHGPFLVKELLKAKERPHYIYLGNPDGPKTLEDWVASQTTDVTPILPDALRDLSLARFRAIQKVLDAKNGRKVSN